jgi:hypothetical protein
MMTTMIVIAGAMLLFTPLGLAQSGNAQNNKAQNNKAQNNKAQNDKAQNDKAADKAKQKTQKKVKKKKVKQARANTASSTSESSMSVIEAKTATAVEDREVTSPSDSFSTGDKVTVWLSVKNPEEAGKVNLIFFRNDAKAGTMELNVGKSYRWRTWARRTVGSAGDWKVDVRDEDGTSLKTLEFKVN